eukprot:TRINITY_DN75728_c0_g1_i1.p1 TRINITY_DN75728_c0_g1~~TRINITY_DN75728_c0_g1_i1.p1  ORF type:complete len:180 (+),score=19.75 TRINITY_DN75728_c0_g1_i1:27-542(+)
MEHLGMCWGTSESWTNPMLLKEVQVVVSSLHSGAPHELVDRASEGQELATRDVPYSWAQVSLTQSEANVSSYRLRFSGLSDEFPRNWHLQGSRDGREWFVLKIHQDDTAMGKAMQGHWIVKSPPKADPYFRHFRLLMEEKGNARGTSILRACCLELYGKLRRRQQPPSKPR